MWKAFAAFMLIGVVAGRVSRPYDMARLREAVEKQCKLYDAEEHVDEVMEGMQTFMSCAYDLVDKDSIAQLQRAHGDDIPKEILTFVKTTCKSQSRIITCFNIAIDAITPCTDPKERAKVDESKQSLVDTADLFCKDDSKGFSEFLNDGAISCMENQLYPLMSCTNKIRTLENYKTLTTSEACSYVGDLISCIVRVLEGCPKPSTADFVKNLFRTAYKGSQCTVPSELNKITDNLNVPRVVKSNML